MTKSNLVARAGLFVTAAAAISNMAGCTINKYYTSPVEPTPVVRYVPVVVSNVENTARVKIDGCGNTVVIGQYGEATTRLPCGPETGRDTTNAPKGDGANLN